MMTEPTARRILIADDEQVFAARIASFLEREGYLCDTVADAPSAADRLEREGFDLLIADIHMPGNERLQLVREGPLHGLAVLLVTGSPTIETAIDSIQLPVVGYLVKPFRLETLKSEIERALGASQVYGAVVRTRERLDEWLTDLGAGAEPSSGHGAPTRLTMETYVGATIRNITEALLDMARVTAGVSGGKASETDLCRLFQCPRLKQYREAVDETIEVLEATKRSFKSKELGLLRQKLLLLKKLESLEK